MADKPKKNVRKTAATMASPSQVSKVTTKSTQQAGRSKSDRAVRQEQNKGVADGTIRLGKSGKSYNVYDAKTGRWMRGTVKPAEATATRPKSVSDYSKPKPKSTGQVRGAAAVQFPALKAARKGEVKVQNGRKFVFDGKVWQLQKRSK